MAPCGVPRRPLRDAHAAGFALGTFVTMLPTLGAGLVLFLVVAVTDPVSKIALFASVLVFNPIVKWGVYALSFVVGVALLGPVDGVTASTASMDAGSEILVRLLVGHLLLAVIATAVGYVAAYLIAVRLEMSEVGEIIEEAVDDLVEETLAT